MVDISSLALTLSAGQTNATFHTTFDATFAKSLQPFEGVVIFLQHCLKHFIFGTKIDSIMLRRCVAAILIDSFIEETRTKAEKGKTIDTTRKIKAGKINNLQLTHNFTLWYYPF